MRTKLMISAIAAAVAMILLPAGSASAFGFDHPKHGLGPPGPGSAVVNVESGPYGQVLVVGGSGAGPYPAGSSLYFPTIDPPTYGASLFHPYQPGCTAAIIASGPTLAGPPPLSCTGLVTDTTKTVDWPAFTTTGYPVAGPGVNQRLLGAVWRTDLNAFQVTYAGHPLYLFDPGPDSFFGANFYETVLPLLPPENTAWFLISPWGTPATGPATLETESPQTGTTYSTTKLAAEMLPGVGGLTASVYSFSNDWSSFSWCYFACARAFIPLTTVGTPNVGPGVNPSEVGTTLRFDGTKQVTYDGHPLYLYDQEQALGTLSAPVFNGTAGNGDGVSAFGGTFSLVSP
jgi:predicted lipoprotein with Yx(FWY)xxD motif